MGHGPTNVPRSELTAKIFQSYMWSLKRYGVIDTEKSK